MITVIPIPFSYKIGDGVFILEKDVKISSDFDLPLVKNARAHDGDIRIIKDSSLENEEYTLTVDKEGIVITASEQIGAYYALQTLRQLSKSELGKSEVPFCNITDKPKYKWRGLHLDESRHFFGKEEVKRYLDNMFMMKLNVFHWHLTDDTGWRIEIKKYPLLTEVGSKRKYTQINSWNSTDIIEEEYGGFYTQEDIKEIVEYAGERGIMVVPEIDFPAHSAAEIAAYPWLACREIETEVMGYFGGTIPQSQGIKDWNRPICAGKDKTIDFVFDVIDEVCDIFPAPFFHIGGDECPKDEWKKCPHCQKRISDNKLENEEDLQGWFNNKVLNYLKDKGKRLIGWNEILAAGNLDRTVVAQYWTPDRDKNAEKHVNSGGDMIMSNHKSFYFDMTYAEYPLDYTYSYKPEKFGVNKENIKNVLGVEGEMWTEWVDGREKLDMNLHPRLQAMAEVAWSPDDKIEWKDFKRRLDDFKPYFDYLGINYACDRVSLPKNMIRRAEIKEKFYNSDTHYEVNLNKKLKAKGEK